VSARHLLVGVALLLIASAAASDDKDGKAVFQRWCGHCHGDQPGAPGRLRLGWNRGEEFARLEQRRDLDAATIARVVRLGQLEMPAFRKTEVSDADLAALIAYLVPK
jgi:(+)-pinoresinol hydroxylase